MTEQNICNRGFWHQRKVLVVDDEPTQRTLLRHHLAAGGYEVVEAGDGEAALAILADSADIRIVITDLSMPRLDGFGLIERIRKTELHYTYILVQTHHQDEASLYRALEMGADDYLLKPVRPVEFNLRIEGAIRLLRIEKFEELVFFLTKLAALQSKETGSHLDRIYHFTRLLARDLAQTHPELRLTNAMAEEIAKVSPLHDLGKVGISTDLLHKSERLSGEEVGVLQGHVGIGGGLIKEVYDQTESEYLFLAEEIAQLHHERWDGQGYPNGLAGRQIPLCARIVCLADAYDAMTSRRSYHLGLSHDEARQEVVRNSGRQFDPMVVEAFLRQEAEFRRIKDQFSEEDASLYRKP